MPVAARSDPTAYALAFAAELLDRDYARQSRDQLLAWAQAEEAPNTLPGVPAAVADKALVLSLAAAEPARRFRVVPGALGGAMGRPGPGARHPDGGRSPGGGGPGLDRPGRLGLAAGRPGHDHHGGHRHPHHRPGRRTSTESLALALTLGSAASQPGYGAVAVDDWTVN